MLKLKIQKEPYWLELGYGVKVKVKPCTSSVFYEAKAYMNSKLAELAKTYKANKEAGIEDGAAESIESPVKREALADRFLLIGLGIAGILEWDGVMEAGENKSAPLTENKIDELFSNFWAVAENFRSQYCGLREVLEAEKTSLRPRQMALRRWAKLLQRMRRRWQNLLPVLQMPIYRNSAGNRCRVSGLGNFTETS